MVRAIPALIGALLWVSASPAADHPTLRLYAAGSLRAAMSAIAAGYESAYGVHVEPVYGASTALEERLSQGEPADLFASADMANPEALAAAGRSGPTVQFARNHLCAAVRPGLMVTSDTLLATLLDPQIKVATSTPKNDPGGDYAWAMFANADAVKPGSRAVLERKAIKIGDVPGSLAIPPDAGNAVVWLFREQRADVFISYCTGSAGVAAAMPGARSVALPTALAVTASYGLTVLRGDNGAAASQFALFILSPPGQKILAAHGFDAPWDVHQPREN